MDTEIQRDIGRHDAQIEALREDMRAIHPTPRKLTASTVRAIQLHCVV